MQMTEEEAKTKWCPQVRYAMKGGNGLLSWAAAINRWFTNTERQDNPEPARCIGSRCALWEWVDQAAMGKARRGECGMKRKTVIIMQQQQQPGPKIPMLRT